MEILFWVFVILGIGGIIECWSSNHPNSSNNTLNKSRKNSSRESSTENSIPSQKSSIQSKTSNMSPNVVSAQEETIEHTLRIFTLDEIRQHNTYRYTYHSCKKPQKWMGGTFQIIGVLDSKKALVCCIRRIGLRTDWLYYLIPFKDKYLSSVDDVILEIVNLGSEKNFTFWGRIYKLDTFKEVPYFYFNSSLNSSLDSSTLRALVSSLPGMKIDENESRIDENKSIIEKVLSYLSSEEDIDEDELKIKNFLTIQLDKYGVNTINHMTHIDNLSGILEHGLLSHNNSYKEKDISNKDVNARRARGEPIHNRQIHDYVPFYFNTRNAMLYAVQKQNHSKIIILGFSFDIILDENVIYSNRNASTDNVQFTNAFECLKSNEFIDFDRVFNVNNEVWSDSIKLKQEMQAEILVPDQVSKYQLKLIYVQNEMIKEFIIDKYSDSFRHRFVRVVVKPELFF